VFLKARCLGASCARARQQVLSLALPWRKVCLLELPQRAQLGARLRSRGGTARARNGLLLLLRRRRPVRRVGQRVCFHQPCLPLPLRQVHAPRSPLGEVHTSLDEDPCGALMLGKLGLGRRPLTASATTSRCLNGRSRSCGNPHRGQRATCVARAVARICFASQHLHALLQQPRQPWPPRVFTEHAALRLLRKYIFQDCGRKCRGS